MSSQSSQHYSPPEYQDYRDSLVAFLDVLGFCQSVRSIKDRDSFSKVAKLVDALKRQERIFNSNRDQLSKVTMTAVSDSVILSMPFSESTCVFALVMMVQLVQYDLLATNFRTLLRGYITKGPVYHKNGLIFGKGYQDAYHCEQKVKGPPRVVLDQALISIAEREIENDTSPGFASIFDFLRYDPSDSRHFVDYLVPSGDRPSVTRDDLITERGSINAFIAAALGKHCQSESIRKKYIWLQWYFNESEKDFQRQLADLN